MFLAVDEQRTMCVCVCVCQESESVLVAMARYAASGCEGSWGLRDTQKFGFEELKCWLDWDGGGV